MLRQVFEAACLVTKDEAVQYNIMDEAIKVLVNHKSYECAPQIAEDIHAIVKKHTGVDDPYAAIKEKDIKGALELEPVIRKFAEKGADRLLNLLKISATGNVMDSAIASDLNLKAILTDELNRPFAICVLDSFNKDISKAKSILIIADNAGEVVFDKLLVEYLSVDYKVVYAVRGKPIINDATIEDALKTGIGEYTEVISTGCGTPGTVLKDCNAEFKKIYDTADVVVSKGQGNFEALSETTREIYFLLKAKCSRIASALDVNVNEYVFKKNK